MHLIYLDESGNTGTNLNDSVQPMFVLGALIVPEDCWQPLERDLLAAIGRHFPSAPPDKFEIHASEISSPRKGFFRQIAIGDRLAFRDDWFGIAQRHGLRLIYRAILKRRFQRWSHATYGAGVAINPHIVAFPLVARVVDDYLQSLVNNPLGIFISDENHEVVRDVEKAIKQLRGIEGTLKLSRIIEKGFFIDSKASTVLQLCDLCVFTARRKEELAEGLAVKAIDQSGIPLIEPLIHRGNEAMQDVLGWLQSEQKKGRPGN